MPSPRARLAMLAVAACLAASCALIPETESQKVIYRGGHPVRITNAAAVDLCALVFVSTNRLHASPENFLDEPLPAGQSLVLELRPDVFAVAVRACNDDQPVSAGTVNTTTAPEIILLDADGVLERKVSLGYTLFGPVRFNKPAPPDLVAQQREARLAEERKTQFGAEGAGGAIIYNPCPIPVRLFLGSPRAFLQGVHVLVGPETQRTVRGAGDLWLLDTDSQPLARVRLQSGVRSVTVDANCLGLTASAR